MHLRPPRLCPCAPQVAGVQGSSATYAALCEVFQRQGQWDKLRTAVQVKGATRTSAEVLATQAVRGRWRERCAAVYRAAPHASACSGGMGSTCWASHACWCRLPSPAAGEPHPLPNDGASLQSGWRSKGRTPPS